VYLLSLHAHINEMHGSRSKIPSKKFSSGSEGFNFGVKGLNKIKILNYIYNCTNPYILLNEYLIRKYQESSVSTGVATGFTVRRSTSRRVNIFQTHQRRSRGSPRYLYNEYPLLVPELKKEWAILQCLFAMLSNSFI
jgi:hypothetical protein